MDQVKTWIEMISSSFSGPETLLTLETDLVDTHRLEPKRKKEPEQLTQNVSWNKFPEQICIPGKAKISIGNLEGWESDFAVKVVMKSFK